jgi:glucosamine-6-phosphate deaminase
MNIRVYRTAGEAARAAASVVANQLDHQPASVLGLPTGRTFIGIYDALACLHAKGAVDFSLAHSFNVDEFIGLTSEDGRSFRAFMEKHLFRRINLQDDRTHFLNGRASSPAEECEAFERKIAETGGIDLLLLGVGANGHIGFNEPGATLQTRTHLVRLRLETRRANAGLFGGRVTAVPRMALTMGIGTLLDARAIVLVATGKAKARAVQSMLTGRLTTARPVSLLQLHQHVEVILDSAAAGKGFPHRAV